MNVLTVMLQAGGGNFSMIIMMVAIFAIMYFFMIRPQQKKQKEIMNFRNNLTVGQEVVTAGGIYGKIKDLDVTTVTLEIASGVKIKIDRNSIYANAQQGTNN
ncbi:MAG: preprotein translocase subunit YajC [Bacteroidaceae bacterium]|nr:preprotein translocase subunit YajC [Bacteroidaceae bacterium]MBR6589193.1 preprotein translocase subunit YajC [Bacteroidaceae bacterium]